MCADILVTFVNEFLIIGLRAGAGVRDTHFTAAEQFQM